MQNIPTKTDYTSSLPAAEFNQIPDELENIITSTGISLSSSDLYQLAKSVANYAAGGDFYTDGGTANNYVLSVVGSKLAPTAYFDGMRVRFFPGNSNTTSCTVNVASLGVKNIKDVDGATNPAAGVLTASRLVELTYKTIPGVFIVSSSNAPSSVTNAYLHIRDEKTAGTNGGDFPSGEVTRVLNTVKTNEIVGASLSSNQITLPIGRYRINALAPAYAVSGHRASLYNVTDSVRVIYGTCGSTGSEDTTSISSIRGQFDVTGGSKVFEIRHDAQSAHLSNGLGVPCNSATGDGSPEVYTDVEIILISS